MNNLKKIYEHIKYDGIRKTYYKCINKVEQIVISYNYYDTCKKKERDINTKFINEVNNYPKISIVVPVFNVDDRFLIELIESVIKQIYPYWELCLVNAGNLSSNEEIILSYQKNETRIVYKKLEINKGIALNTNEAISLATGDFIAFLDHDDFITQDALSEVANCILQKEPDIIYSDEDKTNEKGNKFFEPHIKPKWSPRTLLSYNYICHFLVVRKRLIDKYGELKEGYEGSQDYEFILRMCENTGKIEHIPKILYHWRVSKTSTAGNIYQKKHAIESSRKVIEDWGKNKNYDLDVRSGEYIGSQIIKSKRKLDENINIIIYDKEIKDKKFIIDKLGHCLGKEKFEVYFYSIDNGRIEKDEEIINQQELYKKLMRNKYTVVLHALTDFTDKELFINLYRETYITNALIVSPLILKDRKTIRSLGLSIKGNSIKRVYEGKKINFQGYMGRLSIAQNVDAIEPITFLIDTKEFIENIGLSFFEIDRWLKYCEKVSFNEQYIVVSPQLKVINDSELIIKENSKIFNVLDKYMNFFQYF
ncbi:glycosyltransferase family 2 protein [Zhenhengia yiwuensis]|uniref:Glycosyltransferase n=1 Tax=Zhenhengia yiwuensis TaxID=2763666 RepID=A0A926IDJ9_9FIRM|nr:glycosyltransferase [Zhenhengia yiwuensis]MBC8578934.1 glycosyltransferase [Zhenhengia yiwuensis]